MVMPRPRILGSALSLHEIGHANFLGNIILVPSRRLVERWRLVAWRKGRPSPDSGSIVEEAEGDRSEDECNKGNKGECPLCTKGLEDCV